MPASTAVQSTPDPRLERVLRQCIALGAVLVVAVPAARGHSAWFGALPLWLLGMPLASWWALHRFRLPRLPMAPRETARRRRRRGAQAWRRQPRRTMSLPRAA